MSTEMSWSSSLDDARAPMNELAVVPTFSGVTTTDGRIAATGEESSTHERTEELSSVTIPLDDLVDTDPETLCPPGLVMFNHTRTIDPNRTASLGPRRIPRVIHVTSKSRCVTPTLAKTIDTWKKYSDHKFYFHNDAAMHRLLFEKDWPEFPPLRFALNCSNTMVEQTDLWRALILWEYGGIYTDIDNVPRRFNPSTTIQPDDQAFFEVEGGLWLSQYFMVAEPRHPIMHLLVQQVWKRLLDVPDIQRQHAAYVTGPGALKSAMKQFMKTHDTPFNYSQRIDRFRVYERVRAGHYVGVNNRTIRVARQKSAVIRSAVPKKSKEFELMGMKPYDSPNRLDLDPGMSCLNHLYMSLGKHQGQQHQQAHSKENQGEKERMGHLRSTRNGTTTTTTGASR